MLGQAATTLVGRSFEDLLAPAARLLFQTHVYPALLARGRVDEVVLGLQVADGEALPVLVNAVGARVGEASGGYIVLVVPIRVRGRWEQELVAVTRALDKERAESRRLADSLAEATRDLEARHAEERRAREFRDAFVGIVSHELRTPITTIYGMSHVLLRRHGSLEPEAVASGLADIEGEADRLRRLTEDLLVLSRAEGGRLQIAVEPLALGHVVRAVARAEQARAPAHRIEVREEPQLPLALGDGTHVEQALRNFISNAVKYSPAGSRILVTLRAYEAGVGVTVADEGPGLPLGEEDRLWELFFRTPDAIRTTGGAGIGLYVSRTLIRAMGGDAWAANSTELAGAEFGFRLRGAAAPDEE